MEGFSLSNARNPTLRTIRLIFLFESEQFQAHITNLSGGRIFLSVQA